MRSPLLRPGRRGEQFAGRAVSGPRRARATPTVRHQRLSRRDAAAEMRVQEAKPGRFLAHQALPPRRAPSDGQCGARRASAPGGACANNQPAPYRVAHQAFRIAAQMGVHIARSGRSGGVADGQQGGGTLQRAGRSTLPAHDRAPRRAASPEAAPPPPDRARGGGRRRGEGHLHLPPGGIPHAHRHLPAPGPRPRNHLAEQTTVAMRLTVAMGHQGRCADRSAPAPALDERRARRTTQGVEVTQPHRGQRASTPGRGRAFLLDQRPSRAEWLAAGRCAGLDQVSCRNGHLITGLLLHQPTLRSGSRRCQDGVTARESARLAPASTAPGPAPDRRASGSPPSAIVSRGQARRTHGRAARSFTALPNPRSNLLGERRRTAPRRRDTPPGRRSSR
jgi:hypothetical protein